MSGTKPGGDRALGPAGDSSGEAWVPGGALLKALSAFHGGQVATDASGADVVWHYSLAAEFGLA